MHVIIVLETPRYLRYGSHRIAQGSTEGMAEMSSNELGARLLL